MAISVEQAAKILGKDVNTIRMGLIQKAFPWGAAVQTSERRYSYVIYPKQFQELVGEVEVKEG
ncbi:hypothetical protein HMPREF1987_01105 [Peptostreptococcaceae bacterium oral taxon 113 str. W5053]|nr:hypothetical protein HMPREF1987_01105 [Peptostreptococcaceae bacterium oral taxon 113 str. W5053]